MSRGYEYCRMDGSTPVKQRPALVHSFNKDKNKFLFLVSKGLVFLYTMYTSVSSLMCLLKDWRSWTQPDRS